ncbi:hypothetical protein E4U53_006033 [Claviceps sorghi]|nr:hypothetical protein E4U53_006033 [Claviceps sorghi]
MSENDLCRRGKLQSADRSAGHVVCNLLVPWVISQVEPERAEPRTNLVSCRISTSFTDYPQGKLPGLNCISQVQARLSAHPAIESPHASADVTWQSVNLPCLSVSAPPAVRNHMTTTLRRAKHGKGGNNLYSYIILTERAAKIPARTFYDHPVRLS